MSDSLSLWDILFLKDEIDLETYLILSLVIPIILSMVIIIGFVVYEYWWDIRYALRRITRRRR